MVDRVGQSFGNYRLLRLLGRVAFAEAYLAEHHYLGPDIFTPQNRFSVIFRAKLMPR